jgi:hypothetical protein
MPVVRHKRPVPALLSALSRMPARSGLLFGQKHMNGIFLFGWTESKRSFSSPMPRGFGDLSLTVYQL